MFYCPSAGWWYPSRPSEIPPSPPAESRRRDWREFLRDHLSYAGAICLPGVNEGRVWRPRWNLPDLTRWFAGRSSMASMFPGRILGRTAAAFPGDYGAGPPVGGYMLWLRADKGLYTDAAKTTPATADSQLIKCWADQSGNGFDAVRNNSQAPQIQSTVNSGKPGIYMVGNGNAADGSQMSITGLPNPASCSVFCKIALLTLRSSGAFNTIVGSTNAGGILGLYFVSNGPSHIKIYSGNNQLDGGVYTADSVFRQFSSIFQSGGNDTLYQNGTQLVTGDSGSNSLGTALTIGGQSVGQAFIGYMVEVLIYPTALGTTDRQSVEAYQAAL
jgi:hypothetical protein